MLTNTVAAEYLLSMGVRGELVWLCRYQCPHCGPMLSYDLVKDAQDNMDDAYDVMDNLKEAFAGK